MALNTVKFSNIAMNSKNFLSAFYAVAIKYFIRSRNFSTSLSKLNPNWITGFSDAEGCFTVSLIQNHKFKVGWKVQTKFQIGLHTKDLAILLLIKSFFGVGTITKQGKSGVMYRVTSLQDLSKIIDHFNKYPLLTFFDQWSKNKNKNRLILFYDQKLLI